MILLDSITINSGLILYTVLALIGLFGYLFYKNSDLKDRANKNNITVVQRDGQVREKDLLIEKIKSEIKGNAQDMASLIFNQWKESELETHRKVMLEAAEKSAQALLALWKLDSEKGFRQDAITRSMGVNFGKITEHLLPFSKHLTQFDPRDVRFIGSPVDLMIFDGATQKKSVIDIYLVEIKTGSGTLSKKQTSIKNAIEDHRVFWKPIFVPEFKWDISNEPDEPDVPNFFAD